jgi:AraC-like DNA-binding protein
MRLRLGFVAYKEKPADYLFKDMRNPRHEIVYVDRGALHVVSGGRDLVMEQGELHVFFPGELHSMWAEPRRAPSFLNIEFSGVIPAITSLRYRRFFTTGPERHLLEGLLRERETPQPYGEELSRCLMSCLLISLLRRAREESVPSKPPPAPARNLGEILVAETKRLIESRLRGPLSLELMARALRVSTSHLSHTFARVEGSGVWSYVLERRVAEAKDLLRNSALPMKDIVHKAGFSSPQQFSRVFKERTGASPLEYARSMRPGKVEG